MQMVLHGCKLRSNFKKKTACALPLTINKLPFEVDKMTCDRYQVLIISVSFMVKSLFFSPPPSTGYHLISEVISHRYFTLRKISTAWPSHRTLINDLEGLFI